MSPRVEQKVQSFFAASDAGDDEGLRAALKDILELNRADHAAAGVPVYAHQPLPKDFAAQIVQPVAAAPAGERQALLKSLLENFDANTQPHVVRQFESVVASQGGAREVEANGRYDFGPLGDVKQSLAEIVSAVPGNDNPKDIPQSDPRTRGAEAAAFSASPAELSEHPPKPIVKPYRRYATPGAGPVDVEMQEAEKVAQSADRSIWRLQKAVDRDRAMAQHPFLQEVYRAIDRYYDASGDRAVSGVRTQLEDLSIEARDRYASYDPRTDRIYFTKRFNELSEEEKIITVIHEALHTTLSMKNEAARVGYAKDQPGGMTFAKHEAYVDNVAKAIAKRLGLIPQNYPPTRWQSYYKG
ncbi:MAG: hypothetical protein KBA31_19620 [Alphaproteobacteria bacterium]|nr:hypothetical protein [Alphaproteobacteria bacterium]